MTVFPNLTIWDYNIIFLYENHEGLITWKIRKFHLWKKLCENLIFPTKIRSLQITKLWEEKVFIYIIDKYSLYTTVKT